MGPKQKPPKGEGKRASTRTKATTQDGTKSKSKSSKDQLRAEAEGSGPPDQQGPQGDHKASDSQPPPDAQAGSDHPDEGEPDHQDEREPDADSIQGDDEPPQGTKKSSKPSGGDSDPEDSSSDGGSDSDSDTDSSSAASQQPPPKSKLGSGSGGGGGGSNKHQVRKKKAKSRSKRKKTFRKTPYDRDPTEILDFDNKRDKAVYDKATSPIYTDPTERYNLKSGTSLSWLDKIKDRSHQCGIGVIEVVVVTSRRKNTTKEMNICTSHASISMNEIEDFVDTFLGTESRDAQEDIMLYHMAKNSVTEEALMVLSMERSTYIILDPNGEEHASGLLFLKLCLQHSAVAESFDPETIRSQLSKASDKFASLKFNVKELNSWVKEKMLHLQSHGQSSTDVLSHVWTAYKSSNDKQFVSYIQGLEDQVRDDQIDINWKGLMKKAQSKTERLIVARNLLSLSDPVTNEVQALQARVENLQSEVQALQTEVPTRRSSNAQGSGQGNQRESGRIDGRTNKHRKKYQPPPELQNEPKPSDPNKKITVQGREYKWCDTHKWCAHITTECRDLTSGGNSSGNATGATGATGANGANTSQGGNRNGRAVQAYNALLNRG